ncbi:hypothetical protein FDB94_19265, partial [Clostridium botulinum]|nr:hypothetical protein [Clostridium botulinum]
ELVKLLTEEVENITGGKVALGDDPVEVANNIEAHIVGKRNKLNLCNFRHAKLSQRWLIGLYYG